MQCRNKDSNNQFDIKKLKSLIISFTEGEVIFWYFKTVKVILDVPMCPFRLLQKNNKQKKNIL